MPRNRPGRPRKNNYEEGKNHQINVTALVKNMINTLAGAQSENDFLLAILAPLWKKRQEKAKPKIHCDFCAGDSEIRCEFNCHLQTIPWEPIKHSKEDCPAHRVDADPLVICRQDTNGEHYVDFRIPPKMST